jgi:A/G-specific adenine glycosylase
VTDAIYNAKIRGFARAMLSWYGIHGRALPWRRDGESLYRLVVTEILVQRTKAETISGFYNQFFNQYPDWGSLASADVMECPSSNKWDR